MAGTRFALILYFRMVVHKAACHTLSNACLKFMKTWSDCADVEAYVEGSFHTGF